MSIEDNIGRIADSLEALVELAKNPSGATATAAPSATAADKEKAAKPETEAAKKKRVKAEKAAEKAAAEKAQQEESQDEEVDGPSKEDVRAALTSLQESNGPKAVKEVLTTFGATSIGKLEPEEYGDVMNAIADLLSGGDDDDGMGSLDD